MGKLEYFEEKCIELENKLKHILKKQREKQQEIIQKKKSDT